MDIIPLPAKIERRAREFELTHQTGILTDRANAWNANYLRELLSPATGFPLQTRTGNRALQNVIQLRLDPGLQGLGREGYRLEVHPEGIVIEAPGIAGVFYGIQSLRQLLPNEIEQRQLVSGVDWTIPCILIEDTPRFAWRGFMLDEGRHFHGKETVLQTLDLMALQKLNVLHWHLTDDQGWRIEIKKHPRLTEFGSNRAGTAKTMVSKGHDGIPHGGFYSQDEIHQLVSYARDRNITIVPEIEMPGHSLAALASYPALSCRAGPLTVATNFGIFPDIFCAGKETVFNFLQEVLEEILALFPSRYIHIGGDEAPVSRWKQCPDCQRRIQEEGLKDEHALKVYFTNRIATSLHSKGRQVIGWNEILQNGLEKGIAVQFWARNRKRLLESIRTDQRLVVMSSYLDTYLDHGYTLMPLSRAYHYDPIPEELDERDASCILGLEFPLWSEWVHNRARLDYQVYPRLTAMSETGWTPKARKDYQDFRSRLVKFLGRLDHLGIGYAPLKDVEPPFAQRWFGIFSILQPQKRTVGERSTRTQIGDQHEHL
jgi:hexosaminidase